MVFFVCCVLILSGVCGVWVYCGASVGGMLEKRKGASESGSGNKVRQWRINRNKAYDMCIKTFRMKPIISQY